MTLDLSEFNKMAQVEEDPDETIIERLRFDDALEIPHQLTDVDVWLNYVNDDLYYLDKEVRKFINKSRYTRRTKGVMKTAVPLVFMQIFGRPAAPEDGAVCRMLHKILKYYCTRYTGISKINGVRFNHIYYFSKYAMSSKRPMSLRLRLEESNNESSLQEYRLKADKRVKPRRGVKAHGPLGNEGSSVPE